MQAIAIFNALLSGAAPVAALVAARLYPIELPQGCALPAIALEADDDVPIATIDANSPYGMRQVDVHLHLVASSVTSLAALSSAVEVACQFQRGVIAGYSVVSIAAGTVGRAETDSSRPVWYLPMTFTLTYRR